MGSRRKKTSNVRIWVFPTSLHEWLRSDRQLPEDPDEFYDALEQKARVTRSTDDEKS